MTVQRFRSIADMPKPWRSPDDPENLRLVAQMIALYWRLRGTPPEGPRVRRFRTVEEMNRDRDDFYRRDDPALARS